MIIFIIFVEKYMESNKEVILWCDVFGEDVFLSRLAYGVTFRPIVVLLKSRVGEFDWGILHCWIEPTARQAKEDPIIAQSLGTRADCALSLIMIYNENLITSSHHLQNKPLCGFAPHLYYRRLRP